MLVLNLLCLGFSILDITLVLLCGQFIGSNLTRVLAVVDNGLQTTRLGLSRVDSPRVW